MKRPQKVNIRPMPLPRPKRGNPHAGPRFPYQLMGGPLHGTRVCLRSTSTLPIVVWGAAGHYQSGAWHQS